MGKVTVCNFEDCVKKSTVAHSLSIIHSGETRHCHVVRTLKKPDERRGPWREEWRAPANSHVNEPSWNGVPQPQLSPVMTALLADIMTATSWQILYANKAWVRGTQLSHFWSLDTQKLWANNPYCFKMLNLGIICYTAIENWHAGRIPRNNGRLIYLLAKLRFSSTLEQCLNTRKRSKGYRHKL